MTAFFTRNKSLIYYASAMAAVIFILHWLEIRLMIIHNAFEVYAGIIAVIFTALGIWLAMKLTTPKTETIIIEKEIPAPTEFIFNQAECERLNISRRELEVLQWMASGCSNAEIAEKMFVSANTVKTHVSNLFEKLDAKRRIQAVEQAKRLGLLP
ncbi:MAG: response regulator transcription factor [Flavobacterium sp.]|nr:MAG: response regulator transcription factor [Flavobacterium sp.]